MITPAAVFCPNCSGKLILWHFGKTSCGKQTLRLRVERNLIPCLCRLLRANKELDVCQTQAMVSFYYALLSKPEVLMSLLTPGNSCILMLLSCFQPLACCLVKSTVPYSLVSSLYLRPVIQFSFGWILCSVQVCFACTPE